MKIGLEHVNITTRDPLAAAEWLGRVFDWHVRWQGPAMETGFTVHVGDETGYLALYRPPHDINDAEKRYRSVNGLNHIGIVVDDLDAIEERVKAEGFDAYSHDDYEPGRRFYFLDNTGLEFEVVCYS
jgi:catechol 2,3-dioxygenase-like lactoylglutathione lyase family enzyme